MKDQDWNARLKNEIYKILPPGMKELRNLISTYTFTNEELLKIRDRIKVKYSTEEKTEMNIKEQEQDLFRFFHQC